jgi:cell division protein FtsI (penicillin-binding protein 3)
LLLLLLVVGARFYDLQVRRHDYFVNKAERQYQRRVKLVPRRGAILDRQGHELAISVDSESIYAIPTRFKGRSHIDRLAAILGMNPRMLRNKLSNSRSFVWIKRQVPPKQVAAVKRLNLAGLGFIHESKRYYPQKQLAANLVGFVGTDNEGLEGIERYYEKWIKGDKRLVDVEDVGAEAAVRTSLNRKVPAQGYDLILTLDKTIQYIAQQEVARACKEFKARQGVVVVMDPQSGELLAMANEPGYNPNSFNKYGPDRWRNRAITDCYEPGSVLKVFVAAAALERGLFSPKDNLWCEQGAIEVAGHTIRDTGSYGNLSFSQVLEHSSNVGAVKIGLALGRKQLYNCLHNFGFGAPTGIDLPGEVGGILRSPGSWSRLSIGSISIGQEISATPLQLANAICAIANGGVLLKPRVIKQISDGQAQRPVKEYKRQVLRRVLSKKTCKAMTSILVNVVERGTGKAAALAQYKVAGKTGSAQKIDPATRGYSKDKWVAWFMGFVPADRPRLAMVVMLDEPQRGEWASEVAAPVFARIAQPVLKYLGVSPDRAKSNLRVASRGTARKISARHSAKQGSKKSTGRLVVLPDLKGKSMRRVVDELTTRGLLAELEGSGKAVAQYPEAGARLPAGSICRVSFAPLYGRE